MANVKLRNIPLSRLGAGAAGPRSLGDVDVMFDNLGVSMAMVTRASLNCWRWHRGQRMSDSLAERADHGGDLDGIC